MVSANLCLICSEIAVVYTVELPVVSTWLRHYEEVFDYLKTENTDKDYTRHT